jgi:hypothetical protein
MQAPEQSPQVESDNSQEHVFLNGAIKVVRRQDDYMAYVDGDTRLWDCGSTVDEAIGKLIRTHPQEIVESLQPEPPEEA